MEPLKFKIQNVFCIPLKSMNEQQLFAVSESYTIAFDALIEIKKSGKNGPDIKANGIK
jgi:hypothetical protein